VENALLEGRRAALVAMATGTGKTRTAVGLLYRLLKVGLFRRVLFLVDRTALGEQALGSFSSVRMEGTYTFDEAYEVAPVDSPADGDTVLDIATVQGMVRRVLYADPGEAPPVDSYDLILVARNEERLHDVAQLPLKFGAYPSACAALAQRVTDGGIHFGRSPLLLADAIHATAAALPAGWVWDRKVATPPTHLIAATAALWALEHNDGGGVAVY